MTSKGNYLSINFIFRAIFPKKGVQIIYKDRIYQAGRLFFAGVTSNADAFYRPN